MKKFLIFSVLVIILLFSDFGMEPIEPPPPEPITLQQVMQKALERRQNIEKPSRERALQLAQYRGERTINRDTFTPPSHQPEVISYADAISDAELFFDALRQLYAAYFYFGGDGVFLPALNRLTANLALQEYWYISDFTELVYSSLNYIINDLHFAYEDKFFGRRYDFFITEHFDDGFNKSSHGYYNRRTRRYVGDLVIDGESLGDDLSNFFRLSICDDGEFYYSIVIPRPRGVDRRPPLVIMYENSGRDIVSITPIFFERFEFENVSLQHVNSFPVITIREMGFSIRGTVSAYYADKFMSLAEKLRNEPVIIVDIRSNSGGCLFLPMRWLQSLTGQVVTSSFLRLDNVESAWDLSGYNTDINTFFVPERIGEHHILSFNRPREIVSNKQTLILLTDRFTASAAEGFTDLMFGLENSLVIGQNTGGAFLADLSYTELALPNSGVTFSFGGGLFIHPPDHASEGMGIAPDVWVNGDALEAALVILEMGLADYILAE